MEYKKLPVEITWNEEDQATIDIICDACEKRYIILTDDISNLEQCSFCGHYLEVSTEDIHEFQEDSWD